MCVVWGNPPPASPGAAGKPETGVELLQLLECEALRASLRLLLETLTPYLWKTR